MYHFYYCKKPVRSPIRITTNFVTVDKTNKENKGNQMETRKSIKSKTMKNNNHKCLFCIIFGSHDQRNSVRKNFIKTSKVISK